MDNTLELKGKAQGGALNSLKRAVFQGESLFQQHSAATGGAGKVMLSPEIPGDIKLLDVGAQQYRLSDGAFLASSASVAIESKSQSAGKALFGGTGGFFIMETSGQGTLAMSAFGSMHEIDVAADKELILDNGQLVGSSANL